MKPFPAYLIFSLLLLICYIERKSSYQPLRPHAYASPENFAQTPAHQEDSLMVMPFQKQHTINNRFINGLFRPANVELANSKAARMKLL
ncbi:hypothetical protein [Dyadobacter luticola]|uniref:Uncharacterized protein n=1 Tax=Dyadobacter luticola TaxID=1979387 RepID=A0A5R9KX93_9BACT|nr:hypothetical protein [Dyadobacter luticola]TLV00765.1 hypothetical protein FEN17_14900 [Dyadobacter luticola]